MTRENTPVDLEAMLQHLDRAGLSKYDMPEFILLMPLTASGKVIKRELVCRVEEGRVQPVPVRFLTSARG